MAEKVFLNDNLIDREEAQVSVTDGGFLYGAGLFETMRSHHGVVFRLEDHLDRLFSSARALSISHPFEKAYLREAIDRLLQANQLAEARLRLTLTNGPLMVSEEQRKPTLLITATEFRPYPAEYYQAGVLVILCPFRQNPTDPTCGHKTTSYYPRLLALDLAHRKRAAEALWFTTDNRLAEGCVSNIFLVKKSILHTPPLETPVLPGIARRTVGQLAGQQSRELVEKDLSLSDVLEADEIFLTNVIMEVLPVIGVEQHTVGDGKVGPITKRLQEGFLQIIEQQCRRQEQ
ncbi:MAG: aminotransferase class IV [Phycisphaerae bacterium]|nr:aminotransferase class IV [Phycisphaerae bacterium]